MCPRLEITQILQSLPCHQAHFNQVQYKFFAVIHKSVPPFEIRCKYYTINFLKSNENV